MGCIIRGREIAGGTNDPRRTPFRTLHILHAFIFLSSAAKGWLKSDDRDTGETRFRRDKGIPFLRV